MGRPQGPADSVFPTGAIILQPLPLTTMYSTPILTPQAGWLYLVTVIGIGTTPPS